MFLSIDDKSPVSNSPGPSIRKRRDYGTINPEFPTPRTIEACMELGIDPEDLKKRPFEKFQDPNALKEIVELRYQHYLHRYHQTTTEVTEKRKEISIAFDHKTQTSQSITITEFEHLQNGYFEKLWAWESPLTCKYQWGRQRDLEQLKTAIFIESQQHVIVFHIYLRPLTKLLLHVRVPANLLANYHKTVSYLRNSQGSPTVKKPEELEITIDEETKEFDKKLLHEIEKFNFIKQMKQKEVLKVYEDDLKRAKMIMDIQERTKRKEELEIKIKEDVAKAKLEQRKKLEEKMKVVKERENVFNERRRLAEESMKKRLALKSLKLQEESRERARSMQEHERRLTEKKNRANELRKFRVEQSELEIEALDQKIKERMWDSQEKHEQVLNDKIKSIKSKMEKLNEKVTNIQEMRNQKEEKLLNELINKVREKEKKNLEYEKKKEQMTAQRMAKKNAKTAIFNGLSKKIATEEKARLSNLEERFHKAGERIEKKREEEQKQLKLKHELRRLKANDNLDNLERKLRMMEFEQSRILEKEREAAVKIQIVKSQNDIIQQARLEGALQAKLEKERLKETIMNLGKKIRFADFEKIDSPKEQPSTEVKKPASQKMESFERLQSQNSTVTFSQESLPPAKQTNGHLKKMHEQALKYLSTVVNLGEKEIQEIEKLVNEQEIAKGRRKTVGALRSNSAKEFPKSLSRMSRLF